MNQRKLFTVTVFIIFGIFILTWPKKNEPLQAQPVLESFEGVLLNSEFDRIDTKIPLLEIENDKAKSIPRLPFLTQGCQGDDCALVRSLKLAHSATLYNDADQTSPIIGRLDKGEELNKANIFIKTNFVHELPDRSLVVSYGSEGKYNYIAPDMTLDSAELDPEQVRNLNTEEWIYVETADGTRGWMKFYQGQGDSSIPVFDDVE